MRLRSGRRCTPDRQSQPRSRKGWESNTDEGEDRQDNGVQRELKRDSEASGARKHPTRARREAIVGLLSLVELKSLRPINPRRLLWPTILCMGHVGLLIHWCRRWRPLPGDPIPFQRVWSSTPILWSVFYVLLVHLGIQAVGLRGAVERGLREAMLVYNILQVGFHMWIFIAFVRGMWARGRYPWGNPARDDPSEFGLALLIWCHYQNKYVELFDTFFIVLRNKASQMTFLHVYQKILLIWAWFFVLRLDCATGDAYFGAAAHSAAQVVTYGYYLLALLGFPVPWKRRVVEVHMAIFALCIAHAAYVFWRGNVPRGLAVAQFAVMTNLLVLFTDFHQREALRGAESENATGSGPLSSQRKLVFSFDSSGWLYVYHFGVAQYLQDCVLPRIPTSRVGFSGSSGGALTAATLCLGLDVKNTVDFVVSCQPRCARNPLQMLVCAEEALVRFRFKGMVERLNGRLSVLLTRVRLKPPFVLGEAVSRFRSEDDAIALLRATCHVPLVGGVLPYPARGNHYYDGFFWPSVFVPWRHFGSRDWVVKTSSFGAPGAQITPRVPVPPWWSILPPPPEVLYGMYESGYADAADFFKDFANESSLDKSMRRHLTALRTGVSRQRAPQSRERIRAYEGAVYAAWHGFVLCTLGLYLAAATAYALYIESSSEWE